MTKNIKQLGFTQSKYYLDPTLVFPRELHTKDVTRLQKMKLTKLSLGSNVCGNIEFGTLTSVSKFEYTEDTFWERDGFGTVIYCRSDIDDLFPPHMQQLKVTQTAFDEPDFRPYQQLETIVFDACDIKKLWLPKKLKQLTLHNTVLNLDLSKMKYFTSFTINNPGFYNQDINNEILFFSRQCKIELPQTLETLTLGRGVCQITCEKLPMLCDLSLDQFGYLAHLPICPSLQSVKLNEKRGQIIHSKVVQKLLALIKNNVNKLEVILRRTHTLHCICTILSVGNVREFILTSQYPISLEPLYFLPQLESIEMSMQLNSQIVSELLYLTTKTTLKQIKVRDKVRGKVRNKVPDINIPYPFRYSLIEVKTMTKTKETELWKQWTWLNTLV